MREKEFIPLVQNGFKDISESDLHKEFVKPFNNGHEHRTDLLIDFGQFLTQFKKLGLQAELWIDGSFATYAPDPSDVDVVFYFDQQSVDSLDETNKALFNRLFMSKQLMKNLYNVEVHYAQLGNKDDYDQWSLTFGTWYDKTTPKGIFRINYN